MSFHEKKNDPAMADYEQFRQFFERMGVVYESFNYPEIYGDEWREHLPCSVPPEGGLWITPAQAGFVFDLEGNYLGVYADDMGYFDERRE